MTTKDTGYDEDLKRIQQKYINLFENDVVGMYRTRIDGLGVLEVNQALCNILRFTKEEILTKPDIIRWADPKAREVMVNQLKKYGSVVNYEADILTRTGEIRHSLLSLKIYPKEDNIDGILIDITKRKLAEKALEESEARYRFLTEKMNDLIWTADLDIKLTYMSPSVKKILGYTPDERIQQKPDEMMTPESYVHAFEILGKELQRDQEEGTDPNRSVNIKLDFYRKDGSIVPTESVVSFIRDADGQLVGIHGVSRDINERRQTEEALHKSEAKYRFLTERMNDIVWTTDLDLNVTYDSPVIKRILGYTAQEREGQKIIELLTPESYAQALEVLSAELKRDQDEGIDPDRSIKLELECYHKNGSPVWMECAVSAIRDDSGKIIGFHGVSHDITERKQAETALKESERRFRSLIQKSLDMIIILDREGVITYGSPSIENILGYSPGYRIGESPLDLIHPEDLNIATNGLKQVYLKTNPSIPLEFRLKKADDTWVYIEAVGQNLLEDSAINGIVITARDITERKKAEQRLQEEQIKFFAAFHESPALMVITEAESGKTIDASKSAVALSGYSYDEVIGLTSIELGFFNLDVLSQFTREIFDKGFIDSKEIKFRTRGGDIRDILHSARLIEINNRTCILSHLQDITVQRKAEEELKKYHDHLEELIQERTADLGKAYELLKQENDVRKITEVELERRTKELEEMNSALRVLLKQREHDKFNLEENIITNIKMSVMPYVEKIDATGLREEQREYLSKIKLHLGEITSPFIKKLSSQFLSLTTTELKIASMISDGKGSKEIAGFMNVSINTIHTYRNIIRKKLDLKNDKINLRSYLQTLG